jgi:hypothetical protein
MPKLNIIASLVIVVMGCMDWLTTVIGVSSFNASEVNPFLSGIVSTNLLVFTIIKLSATAAIALSFYMAYNNLLKVKDQLTLTFKLTNYTLKTAYIAVAAFLAIIVMNNLSVLVQAL